MKIRMGFKLALIERWGTAAEASDALGISVGQLSRLTRGHVSPTEREMEILKKALGHALVKRIFSAEALIQLSNKEGNGNSQESSGVRVGEARLLRRGGKTIGQQANSTEQIVRDIEELIRCARVQKDEVFEIQEEINAVWEEIAKINKEKSL